MTENDPIASIKDQILAISSEVEAKRQSWCRIYLMGVPMTFALFCAMAATKTSNGIFPWPIVILMTFVAAGIGFQMVNSIYRKQAKKALFEKIASGLGLRYDKHGAFLLKDVEHHKIIPLHDIQKIEDGFAGKIGGVPVSFEEVLLTDKYIQTNRDGTRDEREEVVFWGLFIRVGIGKQLESHTVVLPRNALQTFFRTTFSSFEKVNLVSPKFEEMFDVMSTSQVEARYVLDPAFMERFMEVGKLFGSKWMEASFKGSEIAFAVQRNRQMFEIGWMFKPVNEKNLKTTLNDLRAIVSLVDALKLNPHTGLGAAMPGRTAKDEAPAVEEAADGSSIAPALDALNLRNKTE